jgi:hypothetical protein
MRYYTSARAQIIAFMEGVDLCMPAENDMEGHIDKVVIRDVSQ